MHWAEWSRELILTSIAGLRISTHSPQHLLVQNLILASFLLATIQHHPKMTMWTRLLKSSVHQGLAFSHLSYLRPQCHIGNAVKELSKYWLHPLLIIVKTKVDKKSKDGWHQCALVLTQMTIWCTNSMPMKTPFYRWVESFDIDVLVRERI